MRTRKRTHRAQENKRKFNRRNAVLSIIIVVMMLVNVSLVYGIYDIHENGIKAELLKMSSLKSLTTSFISHTTDFFSSDIFVFAEDSIEYFEDHIWRGPVLSRGRGTIQGPSGKETYYNLNMSGVVSIMRRMGYDYEYWVRDDGVKMFGNYVMIAANLNIRPRGSLVQTSLGMGMVCDTGTFAKRNPTQIDIATSW